jgi:hypothetical protein
MDFVKPYRFHSINEALMAYCLRMLRQLGAAEGSAGHLAILKDYNTLANTKAGLPRGHKAVPSDDWCAEFAAGQAHALGLTEAYPMECSCSRIVQIAKEMGIWIESDSYIPVVGDWVLFAWKGQEGQENELAPNHIGTIYGCDGENMLAVEGNKGDKVDTRALAVGDKRIRGFVHPDLSGLVGSLIAPIEVGRPLEPVVPVVPVDPNLPVLYATVEQVPEWGRAAVTKLQERGWLQGVAEDDLGLTEELVRTLTVLDRAGVFELPI